MKSYHQVLVPALDTLIGNPEILNPDTQPTFWPSQRISSCAQPSFAASKLTEARPAGNFLSSST